MKKIFFALMFVVTIFFANTCAAQDVWVDHWGGSDNVDIYVMDDTIVTNSSRDGFSVVTKQVRNGQILKTIKWNFYNVRGSWRYSAGNSSHDNIVYNSKIFEFCMNQLGWSYNKDKGYYN